MQFLQWRSPVSGAMLRVSNIYISMFPGGFWVQLLDDNGGGGSRRGCHFCEPTEYVQFSFCSNSGLSGKLA